MTKIGLLIDTIKKELAQYYPSNELRAIIHVLFKHYAGFNTVELYINLDKQLNDDACKCIADAVEQLKQRRPLQYIIGETEFYGLPFYVDENVLIPRPETEELVQWVISDYGDKHCELLDVGTGSGCIAVSLAKELLYASVWAMDISEGALQVAACNAKRNGASVRFLQGDMLNLDNLQAQQFDCIVSNPPYVRMSEKKAMQSNVLNYEPHTALFVDDDNPLVFYHAIVRMAQVLLLPHGTVYVEINEGLADETAQAFSDVGFTIALRCDMNNKPRMIKASL